MNNTETLFNRLITACEIWDLDEVKAVVETGFNVDTADDDRVTALQIAAANGNIGIVSILVLSFFFFFVFYLLNQLIVKENKIFFCLGRTFIRHGCQY